MKTSAAFAAGFGGLRSATIPAEVFGQEYDPESAKYGYGYLYSDPQGILDLPKGFSYSVISTKGDEMDDGLVVPGAPDGMAALSGPYGLTVIIRNHKLNPYDPGAYGKDRELYKKVAPSMVYDAGDGRTPGSGGTSTIVYDSKTNHKVREFLSLTGTILNCAGGPTPWKTWISCEATVVRAGEHGKDDEKYFVEKDHGYNFEVPITARMELTDPIPLTDMGRFNHGAVAVDPKTGIVFQTEDRDDAIFYRFVPNRLGDLQQGGKLQALAIKEQRSADTRNWEQDDRIDVGQEFDVEWLDLKETTSPKDDLRFRGFDDGAARFARPEGIWYGNGELYFSCTAGGKDKIGQIWQYRPSYDEGTEQEGTTPGKLKLLLEPNNSELVHSANNLTVAPWGDLIVCEDRDQQVVRLVGVTPDGKFYPFAMNHMRTKFSGATFSPDGSTLFANLQSSGQTVAIRGPWHERTV
ncbi:MAG: DUF839 domain-containing protein [Planctomycetales bacterium]|nr:DUF839 domain-containing protein [Planctomycetales bacterium]